MGNILFSDEIVPTIELELKKTEEELSIISAYVKTDALKVIDSFIRQPIRKKRLLVRFRLGDILNNSTDFDIIRYCLENNWELYINLDLHSKIIIFDCKKYLLGSANVTLSGLGISFKPNIENMYYGELDNANFNKVSKLFTDSIKVERELYESMQDQLNNINQQNITTNIDWSTFIQEKINAIINLDNLWVSDLISSSTPFDMYSKDRSLLGISRNNIDDIELLRSKFLQSKIFRWFINSFDKEIYFGPLSQKLHSSLSDDPTPYRKDVKEYLSNLLNWIKALQIEEVIIDRPNYSERIRKVSK